MPSLLVEVISAGTLPDLLLFLFSHLVYILLILLLCPALASPFPLFRAAFHPHELSSSHLHLTLLNLAQLRSPSSSALFARTQLFTSFASPPILLALSSHHAAPSSSKHVDTLLLPLLPSPAHAQVQKPNPNFHDLMPMYLAPPSNHVRRFDCHSSASARGDPAQPSPPGSVRVDHLPLPPPPSSSLHHPSTRSNSSCSPPFPGSSPVLL